MAITLPTLSDLFGSVDAAIIAYKELFPNTTQNDTTIEGALNHSYSKIQFVFGEFRCYKVGEDTVRNEHIKRAVLFEANSILSANQNLVTDDGLINQNTSGTGAVKSESTEDVSVTYSDGGTSGSMGMGDSSLMNTLGLLSIDAAIILSRYIRKTYGWGTPA